MELAYIPVLETGFSGFESQVPYQNFFNTRSIKMEVLKDIETKIFEYESDAMPEIDDMLLVAYSKDSEFQQNYVLRFVEGKWRYITN